MTGKASGVRALFEAWSKRNHHADAGAVTPWWLERDGDDYFFNATQREWEVFRAGYLAKRRRK